MNKLIKKFPLHPFLFSVYPALALLVYNIREVEPWVVYRPLLTCLLLAIVLFLLLQLAFKNWQKTAIATTFLLVLFFSYGHVYGLIKAYPAIAGILGHHYILAPVYIILFGAGFWLILRRIKNETEITLALNVVTALLVIAAAGQILWSNFSASVKTSKILKAGKLKVQAGQTLPDIYYIILDMYTRDDVLARSYNYDNQPFIDGLQKLGFTIARCSNSNYPSTEFSLSSSLNMDFLTQFAKDYRVGGDGVSKLAGLMQEGEVRSDLERIGYKSVAFETGYYWDQWEDADIYLAPQHSTLGLSQLRPFEFLLVEDSAAVILRDVGVKLQQNTSGSTDFPFAEHIQREQYLLDKLPTLASIAGPKLVFTHVLIPHVPFIFGAGGEINQDTNFYSNHNQPINESYFQRGYTGQVSYINKRILDIVGQIIAQSKTPPIIIVQGDHGVRAPDRYAILNAYYLPGSGAKQIYPTISPVNTFRVIFNSYFSANYKLLPDTSYQLLDANGKWSEVPRTPCKP